LMLNGGLLTSAVIVTVPDVEDDGAVVVQGRRPGAPG
jgi:hypothetical protein